MKTSVTLALSLLSLSLAVSCGFRFDNPVEQCQPNGCDACCISLPDAGADATAQPEPDASEGLADAGPGPSGQDTGTGSLWLDPSAQPEFVALAGPATVGVDNTDEPFVVFAPPDQTWGPTRVATRVRGVWSVDEFSTGEVAFGGGRAVSGGVPSAVCEGTMRIVAWAERPGTQWDVYPMKSDGECAMQVGAPGPSGTLEIAAICNGKLRHGHWNGDRTRAVQLEWEDLADVGAKDDVVAVHVDPGGGVHVLVRAVDTRLVYWRRPPGGSWMSEVLRSTTENRPVSALDRQGEFAYCLSEEGPTVGSTAASCARKVNGAWTTKTVLSNHREPFLLNGLSFDSANRMHLSTSMGCAGVHWVEDGAGWKTTELSRGRGHYDSLLSKTAFDSKGAAHFIVVEGSRIYHLQVNP